MQDDNALIISSMTRFKGSISIAKESSYAGENWSQNEDYETSLQKIRFRSGVFGSGSHLSMLSISAYDSFPHE